MKRRKRTQAQSKDPAQAPAAPTDAPAGAVRPNRRPMRGVKAPALVGGMTLSIGFHAIVLWILGVSVFGGALSQPPTPGEVTVTPASREEPAEIEETDEPEVDPEVEQAPQPEQKPEPEPQSEPQSEHEPEQAPEPVEETRVAQSTPAPETPADPPQAETPEATEPEALAEASEPEPIAALPDPIELPELPQLPEDNSTPIAQASGTDEGPKVPELKIQFGSAGGTIEQLFQIASATGMRLIGVDFRDEAVMEVDPRTRSIRPADPGSIRAMFRAGATPRYSPVYQSIDGRDLNTIRGLVSGDWPYTTRRILVFMPEALGAAALSQQDRYIRDSGLEPSEVRETIAMIAMINGRYQLQFIDLRRRTPAGGGG